MLTSPDYNKFTNLSDAVEAELQYLRRIGNNNNLVFACGNLGAFEAILFIIKNKDIGVPVYKAISSVSTNFTGAAGIMNRLKIMRKLGLLEEKAGTKKSQVCLYPTEKLLEELGPILCERYQGLLSR
jgi:hypothetical protein